MQTTHISWFLAAAIAPSLFSQAADPVMVQADRTLMEALAKGDKASLAKLLDEQFQWINALGRAHSRAEVLANPPKPKIPNPQPADVKTYTYGELGDVQVSQGREHAVHVWARRAGAWRLMLYQELTSLASPPTFTPGAGKECENPCKQLNFTPKTEVERQIVEAYMKLETAAHARNSTGFAPMVADEFVAFSSNSDRVQTKRSRIETFNNAKDGGVAPTPLLSARMFPFASAVLMVSEHKPDRGKNLRVTRIWVKREGNWMSALSFQTAISQ